MVIKEDVKVILSFRIGAGRRILAHLFKTKGRSWLEQSAKVPAISPQETQVKNIPVEY